MMPSLQGAGANQSGMPPAQAASAPQIEKDVPDEIKK